ncbi:coenzyme F420-0:L-glutamate ligase [Natronolimnohabitans innermongolicus]|uniref:Coenzyme F420:L-glutamate ligase n=1 Tax=Natronolimnohabitans innermongolicus JCM 12255 TaxID=1227499 RepID=L9WXU6_9EURY|nr:coenzyme F420-0:L-glutamate ligase [Natronolimnohabitans innermongolicus]ELY54294.1 F420-0--gamma-glutamyl ligase [Natronolimnohabitans innermongolicus JCM 12255]
MELLPVTGLPEVRPGDDVAALVAERADLEPGDVLTVASTIVSKAEGRTANFEDYPVSGRAQELADKHEAIAGEPKDPRFAQAILDESAELLIDVPFILAETRFGHIAPNAGIDKSNVPDHDLLLLPRKPDESAERIRAGLEERGHEDVAVVVTDTCGRPFRHGQTGVAIGWAGMPASRDWRGEEDRDGHELGVTVQSVVDELAAAANLVTGEGAGGVPAVVVRDWAFGDHAGSDELFRGVEEDLVREALREWEFDG